MSGYGNGRFENEGRIWGNSPSLTAARAEEVFRGFGARSVLVPGAGYGRNADFFSEKDCAVSGIEISEKALKLAGGTAFFIAFSERESGFEVLETGLMEDPEDHGEEGPHVHKVRFVSARKRLG
jgi:SAM-dependent methyltransferase